jgi:hypothetical protein
MTVSLVTPTTVRPRQDVAQLEQGGICGQRVQRPRAVALLERGVERAGQVAVDLGRRSDVRVLQPQRHLLGAGSRTGDIRDPPRQQLEVGVPDPGDVAAVGNAVVQRQPEVVRAVLEDQRAQHLVGARRVLDQQDQHVAAVDRDSLDAPERAAEALEPGADVVERRAQLQPRSRRGEGVVDVVQARELQLDRRAARRRFDVHRRAGHAMQLHAPRDDLGLGPAPAAVRAVVVAQVAHVDRVVDVGVATVAAVLRVGRVL